MAEAAKPYKDLSERTTVLHLSADVESAEPGRETVDLAIMTQRSGWRSIIASSGGKRVTEAERTAVRHKRLPLNKSGAFSNWRNRIMLESILKKDKPALIHAHGIDMLFHAVNISRIHGIPLVGDITHPLPHLPKTDKLLKLFKTTRAMLRVPSEFMVRHIHETFGVEKDRLCLVPPGVDLQSFNVGFISPERLQKLSHQWRLPEQSSIILVPTPLNANMGHQVFLEAMSSMKDDKVYAVILGSHQHAPQGLLAEVEKSIHANGLTGKVIISEDCPDLSAACWLSSLVVAPNVDARGQNQELISAQAVGRPVIVTDVGANPELVREGETALLVKPGDAHALGNAMREALALNTQQRLDLAETTHNFIAQSFPQYMWFEGMIGLYESLLYPSRQSARSNAA